ncbi:DUF3575 domain-containing protein [Parabacteroides sp. PF5-9]|uniref:DUF3575 domain-containing protein n=1 Tax=Parabacteroides sp. PF5-9 TaxID=1742404 RepID=UPI002474B6A0|nr:DUF3575 domain-containing protein [Parabacteroides sp. PF5-9]MDH6358641.1 hypothetical protein [Parabacteroides sp. PF5-9]
MKKLLLLCIALGFVFSLSAQRVAVKNNVLYDLTLTPNLGLEFGVGSKSTLSLAAGYNPFEFGDYKRFKHWMVQPEYRYWFCEAFNGTYLGLHAHGGEFNVADLKLPFGFLSQLEDQRYQGYFIGAGISIGRQWIINDRWNFEASLGLGYAHLEYDKYPCAECGEKTPGSYDYFGPTKTSISFIYFFR